MKNLMTVEINKIVIPDEKKVFVSKDEDLEVLLNDIKSNGVLCPVEVKKENGHLFLVDGMQRIKACKKLGIEHIPYKMHRRRKSNLSKAIAEANLSNF